MACERCGEANPARARYCWACGAELTASPAREVRKTVTILFCDVTGSTGIGEHLDAESVRQVMRQFFTRMREAIRRQGGMVEKFIGDAVMAVFGIPMAHEDDALRAVGAAVEMQAALPQLNDDLERAWGIRLQARIGVNTGEVVAGDPETGSTLVTGDAVNVAARLEQSAAPGEILIGAGTYRLVRNAVRAEPVGPLVLRGKTRPVQAYRLLELTPEAGAARRRRDVPVVDRRAELDTLMRAFHQAKTGAGCQLVTVLGEAGVGKSRLVSEFLGAVQAEVTTLLGSCLSSGEGITYWPIAEAVRQAVGLSDDDTVEQGRRKVCAVMAGEEYAELAAERLVQLMGLVPSAARSDELSWAVRAFLDVLARDRPLVLVIEDIHWAQPALLDLVEDLAGRCGQQPELLICPARHELVEERPDWGSARPNAVTLRLEPLTGPDSDRLLHALLGDRELDDSTRRHIREAAEGNPLFVEQTLDMLIEDGLLRPDEQRWTATADLSQVEVPPTIDALLAARLDRLPARERWTLESASVIGRTFSLRAVMELSPESERQHTAADLDALVRRHLITRDRSSAADDQEFSFSHVLIRDAAYRAMPKKVRADLHRRFAAWLEVVIGDRAGDYEAILGYHLEQAYRYRADLAPVGDAERQLATQAARRLASAASHSFGQADLGAAANLYGRAWALLPQGDPLRGALMSKHAHALTGAGEYDRAVALLTEVIDTAQDRRVAALARIRLLKLKQQSDPMVHLRSLEPEARRAIAAVHHAGDHQGLAEAYQVLGEIKMNLGRVGEAEQAVEMALTEAALAGDRDYQLYIMQGRAWAAVWGPVPVREAIHRCNVALLQGRDHPWTRGGVLISRGCLEAMRGRFELARDLLARGAVLYEELGLNMQSASAIATASGYVELLAEDPAAAERGMRRGWEFLRQRGQSHAVAFLAGILAQAVCGQGRYEEAEGLAALGEALAHRGDVVSGAVWRSGRVRLLCAQGDAEGAARVAREAVALLGDSDFLTFRGDMLMHLARASRLAGDRIAAGSAAAQALTLYEQKGNDVSGSRTREFMAARAQDR